MSLQPVVRVGDPGSHGGVMVTGSPTLTADGLPVCRVGDTLLCQRHGPQPMVAGSIVMTADGVPVCRISEDAAACGAVIVSGSPTLSSF